MMRADSTFARSGTVSAAGLLGVVLLLAGWLLVGPAGYGGPTRWVAPHGASMAPTLTANDLAVLHRPPTYRIGDVIGYRSSELDTVVLHRIVDRDAQGFITRGDANPWRDPDRVRPEQILGTLWFHIPGGGRVLTVLHTPWALAALAVAGLCVFALLGARRRPHSPRHAGDATADVAVDRPGGDRPGGFGSSTAASTLGQGAVAAAALAVACGVLSLGPAAATDAGGEQAYAHHARITYTAPVPVAGVYDHDRLRTGDPIYLTLTPTVTVGLELDTDPQAHPVTGTITPLLQLRAANGWQRTQRLQPPTRIDTDTGTAQTPTTVTTRVDLAAAHRLVRTAEQRSGIGLGGYTLNVVFRTRLRAHLHGQAISDSFAPVLSFTADGRQAILAGGTDAGSAVVSTHDGSILTATSTPRQVSVLRWRVDPIALRATGLGLSLLAAALAWGWWRRRVAAQTSPAVLFGRRLVAATAVSFPDRPIVDVADLAVLDRLATQHDLPVIFGRDGDHTCYHVQVAGTIYRHRLAPRRTTHTPPAHA